MDLDEALEDAEKLITTYEKVTHTSLPRVLKDAVEKDWEFVLADLAVEIETRYDPEQRRKDRTRVVKAAHVFAALDNLEKKLREKMAVKPATQFFKNTVSIVDTTMGVVKTAAYLLRNQNLYEALKGVLAEILKHILLVMSSIALALGVKLVLEERDGQAELLRKRALPQRSGPRYRRRKVHRI